MDITKVVVALTLVFAVSPAWAGPDEDAIRAHLVDTAAVTADFSRTRHPQAVLKMYTEDYAGVQDGEAETLETIRQWLAAYGAELDQGSPVRFLGEVYGIKVGVSGPLAWATYDYVFKMVSEGKVRGEDRGFCTSILRKESSTWLIQHEHCSKPQPAK